jgi:hypothetical protein
MNNLGVHHKSTPNAPPLSILYQVCVPPSLMQDVINKMLERDKKPPLGFVLPQNIIADPSQTYSSKPNPTKTTMNECSKVDIFPAAADINDLATKIANHMHLLQKPCTVSSNILSRA